MSDMMDIDVFRDDEGMVIVCVEGKCKEFSEAEAEDLQIKLSEVLDINDNYGDYLINEEGEVI